MDCVFCKIISGEIKTRIIEKTQHSIAFLDAFPLSKGHTLVIPKNHHAKIQDMTSEENSDLFSLIYEILPKIDKLTGSTLIAVHNGKDAGQEIPHVHVHLVPRKSNDSAGPIHNLFTSAEKLSDSDFENILSQLKN